MSGAGGAVGRPPAKSRRTQWRRPDRRAHPFPRPALRRNTTRYSALRELVARLVGHVDNGNFRLAIMVDPGNPSEIDEARRLNHRSMERALAMEGNCTGEHGIGMGNLNHMAAEHGSALDVMRAVKKALDPDNIMNRGNAVPS